MFPNSGGDIVEDSDSWHIIPVCFRARGGPNGFPTRLRATEGLRAFLSGIQDQPEANFFFPEIWFPNDPISNWDGEPRDQYHLEWAQGPIPEDLGDNIVRREE